MNLNEIKELIKSWNIVWGHTRNHIVLSNYKEKTYLKEILDSNKFLERNLWISIDYFAYPFGLDYTYNDKTISFIREKTNIKYAFSVKAEDFNIINSRYKIPRYDCILFCN
jgi:hypothetical protein